jgi:ketosteroid isomerase-like protein
MSQENVEIVGRLVEAWNRRDLEAILAVFDPDCEVVFRPEVPEPGPFKGHAELREWTENFLTAWESHHAEVVELIEAKDNTVVAMLHLVMRGSGSGIEMDETDAHVFTLRDDKVTRWMNFTERKKALEAAGLREFG